MFIVWTIVLIAFILIERSSQLYFHLNKNEQRCFYDEYYSDLVVMLRYDVLTPMSFLTGKKTDSLELKVFEVEKNKIVSHFKTNRLKGKHTFTVEKSGKYKMCVIANDPEWFPDGTDKIKFNLIVDTDQDDSSNVASAARNKEFEFVNKRMSKVKRRTEEIMKMQQAQISQEDDFSQAQFSNSRRIVFMTMIQIALVFVIGLWQVFSLRKFFREKNIV